MPIFIQSETLMKGVKIHPVAYIEGLKLLLSQFYRIMSMLHIDYGLLKHLKDSQTFLTVMLI